MPGTYGPRITPTTVSTRPPRPQTGGSAAPAPGSRGVGLGMKLNFAKGGSASKRADGCCKKGKTKGKMV